MIKAYCPELIFGLEFAEDVDDADVPSVEFSERPEVKTVVLNRESVECNDGINNEIELLLKEEIADAKTPEELSKVGEKIASEPLKGDAKARLRAAFKKRRDEFKIAATQSQESLENIENEEVKTPVKRRATRKSSEQSQQQPPLETPYLSDIANAQTTEELENLSSKVVEEFHKESITKQQRDSLFASIVARYKGFGIDETNVAEYVENAIFRTESIEDVNGLCNRLAGALNIVPASERNRLGELTQRRAAELRGDDESGEATMDEHIAEDLRQQSESPTETPTEQQKRNAESLIVSIQKANNSVELKGAAGLIQEWIEKNYIVKSQEFALRQAAQKKANEFLI